MTYLVLSSHKVMEYLQEVLEENIEDRVLLLQDLSSKTIDEIEQIRRETYSDYDELLEILKLATDENADNNVIDQILVDNSDQLKKIKFIMWSIPHPVDAQSELDYYVNGGGCCHQ